MKALVYEGPRQMPIREYPECFPKAGEVKIKVKYCGICGSDVHGYTGASGRKIPPMIMGHEFSGVITEVGEGVTKFKVGDRVAVQPVQYCGECEFCRSGNMNICANRRGLGVLDVDGAFTEYICMHERYVFGLADTVTDAEGSLLEPLAVAYHAVGHAQPLEGKNVLIAGTGAIGLLILMLVKANNAAKIVVTDLSEDRLALAREFGADIAINPVEQDLDAVLKEAGIRDNIDVAIECVGATPTCQQTVDFVKIQGRIVWVGNAAKMVTINMQSIVTREVSIAGTYAFTEEDFAGALKLLEQKKIPAERIVSRIVKLEDTVAAFEDLTKGAGKDIKILVDVNG